MRDPEQATRGCASPLRMIIEDVTDIRLHQQLLTDAISARADGYPLPERSAPPASAGERMPADPCCDRQSVLLVPAVRSRRCPTLAGRRCRPGRGSRRNMPAARFRLRRPGSTLCALGDHPPDCTFPGTRTVRPSRGSPSHVREWKPPRASSRRGSTIPTGCVTPSSSSNRSESRNGCGSSPPGTSRPTHPP